MWTAGLAAALVGIVLLVPAILNYDYGSDRKGRKIAFLLGQQGARFFYGTIGVVLIIGGILFTSYCLFGSKPVDDQRVKNDQPVVKKTVPIPEFPDLPAPRIVEIPNSDISANYQFIDMSTKGSSDIPGSAMQLRVYLPTGQHESKSLACVLVAPAGTRLMHGTELEDDDYHAETLPYVKAGMAVINYSLDGSIDDPVGEPDNEYMFEMGKAYRKFKQAEGGVINGRNAIEFALQKLPQVDPDRIYCAGHSSAGTVSLILAAKDPRIKACISYAGCTTLQNRLNPLTRALFFSGIREFMDENSAWSFVKNYKCPMFLFHSRADTVTEIEPTLEFVENLKAEGVDVTFVEVEVGDHYSSMINPGMPRAIEWLQNLPSEKKELVPQN